MKLGKPGGFICPKARAEAKSTGLSNRRLVQFRLNESKPLMLGGEVVGYITSGSFGHTFGVSVGLGYVEQAAPFKQNFIAASEFRIGIAGELHEAVASITPMFDPKLERVKC